MNRPKKLKLYQHEKIQEMPVAAIVLTGKPCKWYRHVFFWNYCWVVKSKEMANSRLLSLTNTCFIVVLNEIRVNGNLLSDTMIRMFKKRKVPPPPLNLQTVFVKTGSEDTNEIMLKCSMLIPEECP